MRSERKKGQVIESFTENMVACEVRFDKDAALFFAEHAMRRFEAPQLNQLRALLRKHARTYQPVRWERVILVQTQWRTEENHHNGVGVPRGETRMHRELALQWHVFDRAIAPREEGDDDEVWWLRSIEVAGNDLRSRNEGDAFAGVTRSYRSYWNDEGCVIVPFTEPALASVEAIARGLEMLNDKLKALLSKDKAAAFLNAGVSIGRLLEARNPGRGK